MPVSLNQYRATVEIFNNRTFVYTSKCKNLFSVRNSQDFCLIDCVLHYSGSKFIFFILFLTLLTSKHNARSGAEFFSTPSFTTIVMSLWITIWLCIILISLSGDVQLNPGPRDKSRSAFSTCHWNLHSVTAHNYAKISLLEAYITAQKFDVVCISETYLYSSTAYDNSNLEIAGYNLIRSDHPSNKKRDGVCIYYKNSLPIRVLSIHYLQECITFELKIVTNFVILFLSTGLRVSP